MILADKIMNERKKHGWSQEELAEKLGVSRQAVSKWEGAQAVPDLNRILEMAELFGVSTDYLLKDEMEPETYVPDAAVTVKDETEPPKRPLSLEEANEYLNLIKKNNFSVSLATALFVLSPVTLILLAGLSEVPGSGISENFAGAIGVIVLLLLIAIGVVSWTVADSKEKEYNFIEKGEFESEYGVESVVSKMQKQYAAMHTRLNIIGIVLCILCPVPLFIAAFLETADMVVVGMVGVLLCMVALAVGIFVYNSRIASSYKNILAAPYVSKEAKKKKNIISRISSCYWCIAVAGYLFFGLACNYWEVAAYYFPIAGVLFAAVLAISKAIIGVEEE